MRTVATTRRHAMTRTYSKVANKGSGDRVRVGEAGSIFKAHGFRS